MTDLSNEPPPWHKHAEQQIARSGLTGEQIVTRALMLGMVVRDWVEDTHDGIPIRFISSSDRFQPGVSGLFGTTIEVMAWRWLREAYPEALKVKNNDRLESS
jgi:hypothetical protein